MHNTNFPIIYDNTPSTVTLHHNILGVALALLARHQLVLDLDRWPIHDYPHSLRPFLRLLPNGTMLIDRECVDLKF